MSEHASNTTTVSAFRIPKKMLQAVKKTKISIPDACQRALLYKLREEGYDKEGIAEFRKEIRKMKRHRRKG